MISNRSRDERAQAYTLEGFVGATIVLGAVLVAFHSGTLVTALEESDERDRQNLLQQEAQDALVVAATADEKPGHDKMGNLSAFVRAWDGTQFSSDEFESYVLGAVVTEQFGESPRNAEFRISFDYEDETGSMSHETVYETSDEEPGTNAVAASDVVTVFGEQAPTDESERQSPNGSVRESVGAVVGVEVLVW